MSALDWRKKMPEAPRLSHTDGMVAAQLGERVVVFPSEAAARFFYEAYADVPNLSAQVETLRALIDEGALNNALARTVQLEARVAQLERERTALQEQLAADAGRRATAVRRATLLAKALRRVRDNL